MNQVTFHEEQRFHQGLIGVVIAIETIVIAYVIYVLTTAKEPQAVIAPIIMALAMSGVITALVFSMRLVVDIQKEAIQVNFVPFVKKVIPFKEIKSYEVRTYRPIAEYGGWGIRYGWKGGMAYNARGNRGVQLELMNGKRLLIGSQKPEEFVTTLSNGMKS